MQGEAVEHSVIAALNRIYEQQDHFDVVVIIRGGGATSDLSGFDTLALAENVANFPLPIITGIGHDRDEYTRYGCPYTCKDTYGGSTVAYRQSVAYRPTDKSLRQRIVNYTQQRMHTEQVRLKAVSERIPVLFSLVSVREQARIERLSRQMLNAVARRIDTARRVERIEIRLADNVRHRLVDEHYRLKMLEQRIEAENPERLLRRGYSITTYEGRAVHDASQLPKGAVVETRVEKGRFKAKVE